MSKQHTSNLTNLLSIDDLSQNDVLTLYQTTLEFKRGFEQQGKNVDLLKNRTIASLFLEDSTRTRASFELAAKRLGANVISFSASASSLKKGESLVDTVQNLLQMKLDLIVMRHKVSGSPRLIYQRTKVPTINAGDGANEHPTQALLDLFTLWEKGFKSKDLVVALKGDVLHSRVAASSIRLWNKLEICYKIIGPKTVMRSFLPCKSDNFNNQPFNLLYNLRIQRERQEKDLISSLQEYNRFFGTKLSDLKPGMYLMHPGPVNRGVEIDSEAADSPFSLILDQVEMGVALRMAILYLLGKKKGG